MASTQITASTCCYCGVGCGVLIEHDGEQILGVTGDPVTDGMAVKIQHSAPSAPVLQGDAWQLAHWS